MLNNFFKKKPVYLSLFTICIVSVFVETYRFIEGDIGILDIAPFGGGVILLLGMYAYKLSEPDKVE